ncbi:MAG: hypothetical protein FJ038_13330 [Chloroflexi bacterium]|nr:hypothetical protein [Chloroflexota bacterium]
MPGPLTPRLRALASFLPAFEAEGFEFGRWAGGEEIRPRSFTMPYYSFSPVAEEFLRRGVAGWVTPRFDWPAWAATDEFQRLSRDPGALAAATPDDLARLLTVLVRSERFGDGQLAAAIESGLLARILRRADALARELGG